MADPIAPPDSAAYQFDNERSTMTLYGSSNVRDWSMDVRQINGRVVLGERTDGLPAIQTIRVEVSVRHLVSDKDRLQRHAHDALKKEEYPTIAFRSSDVQVAEAEADSFSVVANGALTIKGETRSVELAAKGTRTSDGALHVSGEHGLTLSTFNVERPSLMFGAIKVTDPVRIAFDVLLRPRSE